MKIEQNKKTLEHLEKAKSFCDFFSSVNIDEKALKHNLTITSKGLEIAIELLKSLDEKEVVA